MYRSSVMPSKFSPAIENTEGSILLDSSIPMDGPKTTPFERRFNPYDLNGGTVCGIAGDDFVIIAGDTRMSTGYEIISRNQSKLHPLTSNTILAAAGCKSDIDTLDKVLKAKVTNYAFREGDDPSSSALAQCLSEVLYNRRFFPYYSFCILAGLDNEGKGAIYGYDAVGSFKRERYNCMGTGQNFIMPLLDNLIAHANRYDENPTLTVEEAVSIVKEVFVGATERDIYTGDSLEIVILSSVPGVSRKELFQLKKD